MKRFSTITTFVIIGILVMLIGALVGWYVVLRMKGQTISWQDAARGFGIDSPTGNPNGSTYQNIGIGVGGGAGAGFSAGGTSAGGAFGVSAGGGSGTGVAGEGTGATSSIDFAGGTAATTSKEIVFKTPRLWHVTKTPIAGFEFAMGTPSAYFAERATGYLFRADAVSGEILRRTNTLLPKTYEAFIARDGAVLYRNINETTGSVQTFSGVMGSSSSSNLGSLAGLNLRNNILSLAADPDGKNIFFIMAGTDNFVGISEPWTAGKSGKETQVFSSQIADWKPFALADGRLIVAEKPQDGAPGYAYEIRPDGSLKPLVRAAPGLTILPLSGTDRFIFGTSAGGILSLYAQMSTTTLSLPIKTIADKCVWAPYSAATSRSPASHLIVYCAVPSEINSKNFIQNWYMGALHTSDAWWHLDLTSGKSEQILAAETGGSVLDVIDPHIDKTGSLLGFKNNIDGSLWVLRIVK